MQSPRISPTAPSTIVEQETIHKPQPQSAPSVHSHDGKRGEESATAETLGEEEPFPDLMEDPPSSKAEKDRPETKSLDEVDADVEVPQRSRSPSVDSDKRPETPSPASAQGERAGSPEPYLETDPDMASLADHVGRAMVFDGAPVTNVQIPRGYIFDLEVTGPEFWRAHDNVPRGTKRKHEDEEAPQRHGFLAEDVINYGAIQMPGARHPNLTNEIHPIFQRNAFDGCEDDVYEQLTPALRLASMYLTQPTCAQFWVTLAHGERLVDQKMTSRMGRLQHRITKDVKVSMDQATRVTDYIKKIAGKYRVHFTFVQRMMAGGVKWAGVTQKVENFSCDAEWSPNQKRDPTDPDLLRIHTRLSSDWYVAAKKLSKLKFPDTAQLLRFNFGFAVLITHEICHAIELAHIRTRPVWVPDSSWNADLQQEIGHEPFFHDNHLSELGYTWEKYIFGGKVWPINDRMDCLHGLCITDWPARSSDIWDSSKIEYHTIPMTYIESLFQMKTWEQDLDISNTKLWHIRRNGAKSIYLHSFTTMDYNEEQRIKNEEMEELRAELEQSPPAVKKRRTSIKDEYNAVPLLSTGDEALPATQEEEGRPPVTVPDAGKSRQSLAQRQYKRPKLKGRGPSGRGKEARVPRLEGSSAEKAAKRVALGSGKMR
ncbi:MAG: hypothetical protein Q9195_009410 [Heterodermia aff. obscurata]